MQRRMSLAAAIAAALVVLASATAASAQTPPTKLRFQASFPSSSTFFDTFKYWADRVKIMSGGRLEIEVCRQARWCRRSRCSMPCTSRSSTAGTRRPPTGSARAELPRSFGPTPGGPFGFDILDYQGWLYHGGGLALYNELYQGELKRNVVPLPLGTVANQALGWFRAPVKSWEDLKGRKCRQTGLTAEVLQQAGMATVNMPGGEIVPAGERGVIDCGEWVGPAEDMKLGLHTVWKYFYMPSTHEPATSIELLINGDVWKKLPPDQQAIIQAATWEATFLNEMLLHKLNAAALKEMKEKHGVKIERTPDDILRKTLEAWDQIAKEEEAKNPFFKKVYESQRAYAAQVVTARRAVAPDYSVGANYYWPSK